MDLPLFDDAALALALRDAARPHHDASDLRAVQEALAFPSAPARDGMHVIAAAWLDAAAVLRESGLPRTTATLAGFVAAGEGVAALHARRLLRALLAEPANEVPASNERARRRGRGPGPSQ